jgi:hypothetical protein
MVKIAGIFVVFFLKLVFYYYINALVALDFNFADWHYIHRGVFALMVFLEIGKLTEFFVSFIQIKNGGLNVD